MNESYVPQNNVIVVVQQRALRVETIVISKIEPHIVEHVSRTRVHLHLGSGKAVDKPVQRIVLAYAVIDKLGVINRDRSFTEGLARRIIPQHSNLKWDETRNDMTC
jgi:hypothetical protein